MVTQAESGQQSEQLVHCGCFVLYDSIQMDEDGRRSHRSVFEALNLKTFAACLHSKQQLVLSEHDLSRRRQLGHSTRHHDVDSDPLLERPCSREA